VDRLTNDEENPESTLDAAIDRDVILLAGHGAPTVWDGLKTSDIHNHFVSGTGYPLVFGSSCLTGRYPFGYTFPESFLNHGASVYIGAVNNGYGYHDIGWNARITEAFFHRLQPEYTVGESLKHAKRYRMSEAANTYSWDWNFNRYHCAIYHLYGDPKLSIDWGETASAPVRLPTAAAHPLTGPPHFLSFKVPAFTVTQTNNADFVEIPGQGVYADPNRPVVPIYTTTLTFPTNACVQDVTMTLREGKTGMAGLQLPRADLFLYGSNLPRTVNTPGPTWWPPQDYDWSLEKDGSGETTLTLTVYPFFYETNTTDALFYSDYTFRVDYVYTGIGFERVLLDRHVYTNGAVVQADAFVFSPEAQARDLLLEGKIVHDGTGDTLALPCRRLNGFRGRGVCRLHWSTQQLEPGTYQANLFLLDVNGVLLDRTQARFTLGGANGLLGDFLPLPQSFVPGDSLSLGLTFRNTGDIPLDGRIVLLVQDGAGQDVDSLEQDFSALHPGQSTSPRWEWTATVYPRNCRLTAYAHFMGRSTALALAADGASAPLYWETVEDSAGQLRLRWQSVAGRHYRIDRLEDLVQGDTTVTCIHPDVPATPPFNEVFDAPPKSHAFYRIMEVLTE